VIAVSTLILGLVGDAEMAEDSVLGLGEAEVAALALVFTSGPLSLSFFPKTRPRIPPLVEALLSEMPASLTIEEIMLHYITQVR
jgi:hypothetical protein